MRLSKDVLDYIEKEAKRENVDRSVMIRRLMEPYGTAGHAWSSDSGFMLSAGAAAACWNA